jgi:cysteinyl-tRNA synthetase
MEPRATHIAEIIEITEQLIAKGHAYVADNGDVMFDVPTDPNYGQLSRQDLDQLQAGARVDVVDVKHNPMDFVEDVERGRAKLAVAVGRGPSRLAH